MVRNSGGNKAKKKASKDMKPVVYLFDDIKKNDGQEYAVVKKKLGDSRYRVMTESGMDILGISCGNIRKRARVELDDLVLVSLRDYQSDKCDIVYVYNAEETKLLVKHEEVAKSFLSENNQSHRKRDSTDETPDRDGQNMNEKEQVEFDDSFFESI